MAATIKLYRCHLETSLSINCLYCGHQNPNSLPTGQYPSYTARDIVAWLETHDFRQMLWLGHSSDMNIMETLGSRMIQRLRNDSHLTLVEICHVSTSTGVT